MNAAATPLHSQLHTHLHEKALEVSTRYKRTEAELMDILEKVDRHKVYLHYESSSLFHYVIHRLGLSVSVAYNLIAVTRKARDVPALKAEIEAGSITLSNARRIAPILTPENQTEWLAKASSLSQRQLEKEIVKVRPEAATSERATYVTPTRVKLELGLTEQDMLNLRRAQDLLCQSRGRSVSLEDTIVSMTGEYLQKHDPILKAKRIKVKKGLTQSKKDNATDRLSGTSELNRTSHAEAVNPPIPLSDPTEPVSRQAEPAIQVEPSFEAVQSFQREPISAPLFHEINLRDVGKCTFKLNDGSRCGSSRFIDIHHSVPVSKGGKNTLENLVTLCRTHHQWVHSVTK